MYFPRERAVTRGGRKSPPCSMGRSDRMIRRIMGASNCSRDDKLADDVGKGWQTSLCQDSGKRDSNTLPCTVFIWIIVRWIIVHFS